MFTKIQNTLYGLNIIKDDIQASIESRGGSVAGITFDRWGSVLLDIDFSTPGSGGGGGGGGLSGDSGSFNYGDGITTMTAFVTGEQQLNVFSGRGEQYVDDLYDSSGDYLTFVEYRLFRVTLRRNPFDMNGLCLALPDFNPTPPEYTKIGNQNFTFTHMPNTNIWIFSVATNNDVLIPTARLEIPEKKGLLGVQVTLWDSKIPYGEPAQFWRDTWFAHQYTLEGVEFPAFDVVAPDIFGGLYWEPLAPLFELNVNGDAVDIRTAINENVVDSIAFAANPDKQKNICIKFTPDIDTIYIYVVYSIPATISYSSLLVNNGKTPKTITHNPGGALNFPAGATELYIAFHSPNNLPIYEDASKNPVYLRVTTSEPVPDPVNTIPKTDAGDTTNRPAPKYSPPSSGPFWFVDTLGAQCYGITSEECWALAVEENDAARSYENQTISAYQARVTNEGVLHDVYIRSLDGVEEILPAAGPNMAVGVQRVTYGALNWAYANEIPAPVKPEDKVTYHTITYRSAL
jgi:hypothetical protein